MTTSKQGLTQQIKRLMPIQLKHGPLTLTERMRNGIDCLPPLGGMTLDDSRLWGGVQAWTGDEVRQLILHGISEGLTLRRILDDLTESYGEMPTYQRVFSWRKNIPSFEVAYQAAREARGEQVADTATEIALAMDATSVNADRDKIKHLQWLAGKLNRKDYGEVRTVESKPMSPEDTPDDQLDKRIHSIMKRLGMETKVMEAVVVTEEQP